MLTLKNRHHQLNYNSNSTLKLKLRMLLQSLRATSKCVKSSNVARPLTTAASGNKYPVVEHEYDVVVIGAGG